MEDEKPVLVATPPVSAILVGLMWSGAGGYFILIARSNSLWVAVLFLFGGVAILFSTWSRNIAVYADRLVIRYRLSPWPVKTILFKDIHFTHERGGGRSGPNLRLHTAQETFSLSSMVMGNYEEIKNEVIKHVPNHFSTVEQDTAARQKWGLIILLVFVILAILKLMSKSV